MSATEMAAPLHVRPTELVVRNELHVMAPLSPADAVMPQGISLLSDLDWSSSVVVSTHTRDWLQMASIVGSERLLHVSTIGCSTTAGCGSNDPEKFCSPDKSWVRYLQEALLARVAPQVAVRTAVFAKNAVGPGYFRFCTQDMVAPNSNVVLIEVMQNLFAEVDVKGGVKEALGNLLRALRRAAPRAIPIFVNWIFPKELRRWKTSRTYLEARAAATEHGADWLDAPSLLLLHGSTPATWYAKSGADHHPKREGHMLMGYLCAWYLQHRLDSAGVWAVPASRHDAPWNRGSALENMGTRFLKVSEGTRAETCYPSAEKLPVHRFVGNWSLRDEGGEKGIPKLGYVSTRIGDRLDLSLRAQMYGQCVLDIKGRLGFFLTSRPGQGALHLSCSGCRCSGPKHKFMQSFNPFPRIETDAVLAHFEMGDTRRPDKGLVNQNIAVTGAVVVSIQIAEKDANRCLLHVEHRQSHIPRSNTSRVRVDSLTLWAVSNRTVPCS